MFPNNPSFVEKLLQTKQDDILRELPDPATYEFHKADKFPIRLRVNAKIWVPIGILLVLAWWLHLLV